MITISIDPVAFSLGSFAVRWYGILVAVAVITLLLMMFREVKRLGISQDIVYSLALWGIIGGVIGARLFHIIDYWSYYTAHPGEIIGFAGLSLYGAIIGAVLAVGVYSWVRKVSPQGLANIGDAAAVGAPLAQAIGRLGCTINGCCYGTITSVPWAVVYTHSNSYAPLGVPMHPTQIYFLLWNLVVFAVVWQLRGRLKPEGSLFLLYLCLYAVGDFGLRFFRVNDPFLFGLHEGQVISLAILLTALPLLVIKMRRFQHSCHSEPQAKNL